MYGYDTSYPQRPQQLSARAAEHMVTRFRRVRIVRGVLLAGLVAVALGAAAAWVTEAKDPAHAWVQDMNAGMARGAEAIAQVPTIDAHAVSAADRPVWPEAPDPRGAPSVDPVSRSAVLPVSGDGGTPPQSTLLNGTPDSDAGTAPPTPRHHARASGHRQASDEINFPARAELPPDAGGPLDEISLDDPPLPQSDLPPTRLSPDYAE